MTSERIMEILVLKYCSYTFHKQKIDFAFQIMELTFSSLILQNPHLVVKTFAKHKHFFFAIHTA